MQIVVDAKHSAIGFAIFGDFLVKLAESHFTIFSLDFLAKLAKQELNYVELFKSSR